MSEMNMSRTTAPSPPSKELASVKVPKWYLAYFLLAIFDIVTVSASLFLNHTLMGLYADSVEVNSIWATRLEQLAQLRQGAGNVNAPGNDVFDSRDVPNETARLETALREFQQGMSEVRADLQTHGIVAERSKLLTGVEEIENALAAMVEEARQIFTFFAQGRAEKAGERMATMDRKYAIVNAAFAGLEAHIRDIQKDHFHVQKVAATSLQRFEFLIAGFIVVMVIGASLYGHRIYRQMRQSAIEKERFLKDLAETRDAALEAARAKSAFLANMSHEIRTPMNGVLGMTELLLKTELTDQQRRFAGVAYNSGESLLNVLNDILDFSKIEAGKVELDHVAFDLRDLVEDIGVVFAERAQRKGLEITCALAPDFPVKLVGDSGRLRQVLTNLIGNAIKFTERGEIGVRVTAAGSTPADMRLRFEVRDTGIGIQREKQAHIFDAFSQGDPSTTRKYGGTGLGLSISKSIVALMDGEMGVESTPGAGSTFWFTARLEQQPAAADNTTLLIPSEPLHGLRVLVVDDNATNRDILYYQLAACGWWRCATTRAGCAAGSSPAATWSCSPTRTATAATGARACSSTTCPSRRGSCCGAMACSCAPRRTSSSRATPTAMGGRTRCARS
jgi:signal transduction histidine kinase